MLILRNGEPVTTAVLGEQLELKWKILDNKQRVDYFIRECIAERIDGQPPSPRPLQIITNGYI
jgi:hypothetical protein